MRHLSVPSPSSADRERHQPHAPRQMVKCLVWDLDHTLWHGSLLEDRAVTPRPDAAEIIRALDARGILQSIASRNDREEALAALQRFGLAEFFLHPQVTWGSKVGSIRAISESLNINPRAMAFVDDEPAERDEVRASFPDILCLEPAQLGGVLAMPEFTPPVITPDTRLRRQMYVVEEQRRRAEEEFAGPTEAFLAQLGMVVTISRASEEDLVRAHELCVRTNQLNSTGYTYSLDELSELRRSASHDVLMAKLEDRYGPYGNIGLALLEVGPSIWTVKLLLVSCRVISRGIGGIILAYLMRRARAANRRLQARFVDTGRNRLMYISYRWAGFREVGTHDGGLLLEHHLERLPAFPDYVTVNLDGEGLSEAISA